MDDVVEVAGLTKHYGTVLAVDDVGFDVAAGEIFGLLGRNGAGKTTTVECVQGLRRPDAGRIRVLGLDPVADAGRLRRRIGSQLQQSALPDRMRVWEALDLFGSLVSSTVDHRLLLDQWGLTAKRNSPFASLSGGQRQRLFVALALVSDPEVVFLDEMTTGLDPAARRVAWQLIREIADRGTTVVLVTHFMEEAEHLCDRVAVMADGRLVALGTPRALVNEYVPQMRVTFRTDCPDVSWLNDLAAVRRVRRHGARVEVEGVDPVLALVAAALVNHGVIPRDLQVEQPTLEDAFLRLSGMNAGSGEE
jgi:ABC-2 type transport system ATP-binding protein